jgi:hypothetical protein
LSSDASSFSVFETVATTLGVCAELCYVLDFLAQSVECVVVVFEGVTDVVCKLDTHVTVSLQRRGSGLEGEFGQAADELEGELDAVRQLRQGVEGALVRHGSTLKTRMSYRLNAPLRRRPKHATMLPHVLLLARVLPPSLFGLSYRSGFFWLCCDKVNNHPIPAVARTIASLIPPK